MTFPGSGFVPVYCYPAGWEVKVRRYLISIMFVAVTLDAAQAEGVKIHNVEYPSALYGEGGAVITVESSKAKVECVAYKDGVPVGSGSAYTTARIANIHIMLSRRKGHFTVKCS